MIQALNNKKITRHNDLVNAKMGLSTMQWRVFLKTISLIHKEDIDFKTYEVIVADLLKECGVKSHNWYSTLKEEIDSLANVRLKLPRENKKDFLYTGLFSSIEYKSNEGILELSFDPKLKPYLLQIKGNFTTYELQYVLSMKSQYAIRIYELLKQYLTFGKRRLMLSDLRSTLSLEDKYTNFADFKKRVLDPAQKECKKHSDINFTFKPIKQGRKTIGLDFLIKRKDSAVETIEIETKAISASHSEFVTELIEAGLSEERISEILSRYNSEEYLKFVWIKCKTQNPKKLDSFYLKSLQDGYYEKNYAEMVGRKQAALNGKQKVQEQKAKEKKEQLFDSQFNAFYNQSIETILQETISTRFDDRLEFESIMKTKLEANPNNPAIAFVYESYIQGDANQNSSFRMFLLEKYGKLYQYNKEAYRKYINQ